MFKSTENLRSVQVFCIVSLQCKQKCSFFFSFSSHRVDIIVVEVFYYILVLLVSKLGLTFLNKLYAILSSYTNIFLLLLLINSIIATQLFFIVQNLRLKKVLIYIFIYLKAITIIKSHVISK